MEILFALLVGCFLLWWLKETIKEGNIMDVEENSRPYHP
jgi:hypothetical protein